jgi:simple sugar transport system permease protein
MWQFQPRTFIPWYLQLVSPLIAVCLTILLGMGLFSFLGKDPLHAMYVFFISPLSDGYNVGELLVKTAPMLLCAIGLALCYQANLWNIGAEGQLLLPDTHGRVCNLQTLP